MYIINMYIYICIILNLFGFLIIFYLFAFKIIMFKYVRINVYCGGAQVRSLPTTYLGTSRKGLESLSRPQRSSNIHRQSLDINLRSPHESQKSRNRKGSNIMR